MESCRWLGLLAIGSMVLTASPASAVGYPFKFFREQNIDNHQVGHVALTIDPLGAGTLEDFWSNGKKVAGNTFYAIVVLISKDGKAVWSDKETKGLDGSFGGRAREGSVTKKFHLTKEQMDKVDHVELNWALQIAGWY